MPPEIPQAQVFHSPAFLGVIQTALDFFKETPVHDLPPNLDFRGPGVYALYYHGDFPLYSRLVEINGKGYTHPIYVGKAVPPGWRTNRIQGTNKPVLKQRLREHSRTIDQCSNLNLEDFKCRFSILNGIESDLIGALEAELIRHLSPVWNTCLDGFGDHDPGDKRYDGMHTEWDTLHPGRSWATRMRGEKREIESIKRKVTEYLKQL